MIVFLGPSRTICSLFENDTNIHIFTHRDTTLFVTATDTLSYVFRTETINPLDSIFISATGNIFATNRILSSHSTANLKEASFSFTWRSLCEDLKRGTDTLQFHLLVRDNECPQSRTQKAVINIVVIPPPPDPAPVMQCTRTTGSNSVLVRWNKPASHGKYFSQYVLLRKNVNGTWDQLATVPADSALVYEDINAFANERKQHLLFFVCHQ